MNSKDKYALYLASDHWAAFKVIKLEQEPRICLACKATEGIDLHHMKYRPVLETVQLNDTCWLCRNCHAIFHRKAGTQLKDVPYSNLRLETVRAILGARPPVVVMSSQMQKLTKRERAKRRRERNDSQRESIAQEILNARVRRLGRVRRSGVGNPVDSNYYKGKKVSYAEQEKHKTKNGGYSKRQLEEWGIVWPPMKGWPRKLHQGLNPNI